jgi:hypothetical protein
LLSRIRSRRPSHGTVVAYLALFVAVSTGGAYAANTIGSSDVIDESLLSQDIKNGEVKTTDLADAAVTRNKLISGAVTLGKIGANAVDGTKVVDNSLTGADIAEPSLSKVPSAANADTVGGQSPGAFLGANAKAADSDKLDGKDSNEFMLGNGRIMSNRVVATAQGTQILNIPFMGVLTVDGCDHINGRIRFDTVGSGFVYFMVESGGSIVLKGAWSAWTGGTAPEGIYRMQMSRNTGSGTQMVDITVTWNAVDCVFAAQAVQQPAL